MGPVTRKRKESPPNRTLLEFFQNADTRKRAKVRMSHLQQSQSSVPRTVASREVIIIDSDSDDAIHKREDGIRSTRLNCKTSIVQHSQSVNSDVTRSEDRNLFGIPSALLLPPNPRVESSSNASHHPISSTSSSGSMFGTAALLLEQPALDNNMPESQTKAAVACEHMSDAGDNSSYDLIGMELPIGEWAAGDDELIAPEVSDDNAEIGQVERELCEEQCFCPVCGIDLTEILVLEASAHVNQCLDAPTLENDKIVVREPLSTTTSTKPNLASDDETNTFVKGCRGNLYTALMNSHKENESWVEADAAVDRDLRLTRGNRRRAPFYKVLQGMPIAVDAFCYGTIPGVTAYFLTHAHSDHYTNLGSKWKSGPIYCSEETAKLITHMLAVDPSWIHPLPLDIPTVVPETGGVSVTLIEANHCPGSCLFFFEGQQTVDAGDSAFKSPFVGSSRIFRYLHCGDFRASPRHVLHPAVNGKHIDHVYLDTTYLDPKYTFSPQPLVIFACAELARRLVTRGTEDDYGGHTTRKLSIDAWVKSSAPAPADKGGQQRLQERILVIVGTYSIGKERIVKAIAQALGAKVYCDARKAAILRCQADKELHALLTSNPTEANVHILPLGAVTSDNLKSYLQKFNGTYSRVISFRPTGWTYSPPSGSNLNGSIKSIISQGQSRHFSYTDLQLSQKSTYNIQIFGIPYSEHSSFFELTCFAMSCDWGRMIPTVNVGNPTSRAKMSKWFKRWELEKRSGKPPMIQPRTVDYW